MDYKLLLEQTTKQFKNNLPFVVYSLPNQDTVTGLLQKSDALYTIDDLTSNGFVISSFENKDAFCFIPESDSEIIQCKLSKTSVELTPVNTVSTIKDQEGYVALVSKTIESIKNGNATKIVLSRPKDFQLKDFSLEVLFARLFSAYPTAFRYIWFHPKTGIWCGATPEILVEVDKNSIKTMALAGTQPKTANKDIVWGSKEVEEQRLVTEAITNNLKKITSSLKVSKPHSHQAATLFHLKTDISGVFDTTKTTLTNIATAIHPTPAVCGTPLNFAKSYILENEGYNRDFYTGFLGPIQQNGALASLMVNLRCMKINTNTARIFVGGGITQDSKPTEEWVETQNKMQTMLQVLQPML